MPSGSENPPRVSFIIPTLNVEALLDNCLASIARQTYPRDRYEIILADAHSTDRTRDIAKKYGAHCPRRRRQKHGGRQTPRAPARHWRIHRLRGRRQRNHPRRLPRTGRERARSQSAGARRGELLFALAQNEFVLRLPHPPAAHQRPDCLADERESETRRARRRNRALDFARRFAFVSARRERLCLPPRGLGIREGRRTFSGHARGAAPHAGGQARVAARARTRRPSLLRPDALGLRKKTPPRHGAFSPRAGGNARRIG